MIATKILAYTNTATTLLFKNSSLVVFTEHGVEVLYKRQHYKIIIDNFNTLNPSVKEAIKEYLPDIVDCAYFLEYGIFPSALKNSVNTAEVKIKAVDINELLLNVLDNIALALDPEHYGKMLELLADKDQDMFVLIGVIADELRGMSRLLEINEVKKLGQQSRVAPQTVAFEGKKKAVEQKRTFMYFFNELAQAVEYLRP